MRSSLRQTINVTLAVAGAGLLVMQFNAAAQIRLAKDPGPRGGRSRRSLARIVKRRERILLLCEG